jgi:hypothetical protein
MEVRDQPTLADRKQIEQSEIMLTSTGIDFPTT